MERDGTVQTFWNVELARDFSKFSFFIQKQASKCRICVVKSIHPAADQIQMLERFFAYLANFSYKNE